MKKLKKGEYASTFTSTQIHMKCDKCKWRECVDENKSVRVFEYGIDYWAPGRDIKSCREEYHKMIDKLTKEKECD